MITPLKNKKAIKKVIADDPHMNKLGFNAKNVKTTKASNDIFTANKADLQINISMGQPEKSYSDIVKNLVYVVTVSGNRNMHSDKVDDAVEQVIALLDRKDIGDSHILYLLDGPLELASDQLIYIVETTFLCQSTVFNVVRK